MRDKFGAPVSLRHLRLAEDIAGIAFKSADKIAAELGIAGRAAEAAE